MLTHRSACSSSATAIAAVLAFASLSAGCPDPAAEFDSFENRYEDIHGNATASTTGGGACDYEALEGEYLFALSTGLLPTSPVMFRTTVKIDGNQLSMDFQPLKAKDKTTAVGDLISVGPFEIAAEGGAFTANLGMLTIVGAANPLTGSDIEAVDVVLTGALCTGQEGFICGTVAGHVNKPTMLELAPASTFGMVKIVDGILPEKTTLNCAGGMGTY